MGTFFFFFFFYALVIIGFWFCGWERDGMKGIKVDRGIMGGVVCQGVEWRLGLRSVGVREGDSCGT